MKLQIINPITHPGWDELLLANEKYSFFHSAAWAKVLIDSYNYKPVYFTYIKNKELLGLIPLMEIKSFLTGKRAVSLPFTDHCPLPFSKVTDFDNLIYEAIIQGKKSDWKYIELRDDIINAEQTSVYKSYYTHTLNLDQEEKYIYDHLRDSNKRNIRKALKEGVEFSIFYSLASIKDFYYLNCLTRKRHGLPPQPYKFFINLYNHVISKRKGFVAICKHEGKIVAGALFFLFNQKVIFKYGGSDINYQHLRANNLVMWEAIKWSCKHGFKNFIFGRTSLSNDGLLQFKHGWGVKEETINYYRYDLSKSVFLKDHSGNKTSYNLMKKLPSPILNLAGSLLYRHVG